MKHHNSSSKDDSNAFPRHLPPVGKDVLVKNNGRERHAYRDADGKWRNLNDGSVLQGEVQILKVE